MSYGVIRNCTAVCRQYEAGKALGMAMKENKELMKKSEGLQRLWISICVMLSIIMPMSDRQ